MTNYYPEEKIIIVGILIAIMEADGIIDPNETELLDKVIRSFGLTDKDLDELDEADMPMLSIGFSKFSQEKKALAKDLFLRMAACDGHVDECEVAVIQSLG